MLSSEAGRAGLSSIAQPQKALSPMDFSAVQALMSTVVSLVHPANALWLMEVSPAGSVMAGSSVQAAKALSPMT